jgi:uncharacterized protein (DUF1778 family)
MGMVNGDVGAQALGDRNSDSTQHMYVVCANIIPIMQTSLKPRSVKRKAPAADTSRSARLGLRSTAAQEMVLRRAAEVAHKSLTDFILDSACLAAEQTLLDQRLFMANGTDYQALLDLLDRPARSNPGLKDLFSRTAPWDKQAAAPSVPTKPKAKKPVAERAHART